MNRSFDARPEAGAEVSITAGLSGLTASHMEQCFGHKLAKH